jgi:ADP-ribose pyrophosphatase YjhB (NUDIX family)
LLQQRENNPDLPFAGYWTLPGGKVECGEAPKDAIRREVMEEIELKALLHQEEVARPERVVARRQGRSPRNWRESARRLIAETPPGESRLAGTYTPDADLDLGGVPADELEYIVAKIADALEESAADGAVLVES